MRRLWIALSVAIIVGAAWLGRRHLPSSERADAGAERTRLHTVGSERLVVGLTENGQLKAIRHHRVIGKQLNQQTAITWIVEEYKEVKKGDRLLELDRKAFETQIVEQEKNIDKQREDLERLKATQTVHDAEGRSWIRDAEVAIEKARNDLRQYQYVDAPQKLRELDDGVTKVKDEQNKAAEATAQAQEKLEASVFESKEVREGMAQQAASTEGQLGSIDSRLTEALTRRNQFRARTYPEELKKLRREIDRAQLQLEKEKARAQDATTAGEQGVINLQRQIEQMVKWVDTCKEQMENCVITAPADGVVLYGDPELANNGMAQYLKVGQNFWGGNNVIMSIPDMSAFAISVPIPEHYRGRVQVDSAARISVPAIPGLDIKGRLVSISTVAQPRDPGNPSSPKVFTGRVEIEASDPRMVSGMSAKVTLVAKVIEQCLCAPIEAVWTEGDTAYVYLEGRDGIERREVETGSLDDKHVEIVRGLAAGDRVWLYDPAADGRPVQPGLVKLPAAGASASAATPAATPAAAATAAAAPSPEAAPR